LASTNKDDIGIQPLSVPDWSGGINTAKAPTEIADNEAVDILNFEFDDSGNLASRRGVTFVETAVFAGRITSLYYFVADSGEVGVLMTGLTGLAIFQTDGSGFTNLTGANTFPNDTFWQWVTYGGIAIGVNQGTTGTNPVKVTDVPAASALGGSPPKAKYIEIWNDRVWLASATEPNQIKGSALGLPEDWTVDNDAGAIEIDVDANDGDHITGLVAHRGALYVFKRKSIHRVVPISNTIAPTVASNLKVEVYARGVGCVSGYSIAKLLDDIVFLSELGLASLRLAQDALDFRTATYSRNVVDLFRMPKISEEIPGFLFDTAAQYWLSVPAESSYRSVDEVFVLDYLKLDEQVIRWTRFNGLVAGTAFTSFPGPTGKVYLIGAYDPVLDANFVYRYKPRDILSPLSDDGREYTKQLRTKAYSANLPLIRKHFHKWAFGFALLSTTAQVLIQYYLNEIFNKGGNYSFNLIGSGDEALWDEAIWDTDVWDSGVLIPADIVRRLLTNSSGQRGQNISFLFTNAQADQGLVIKHFMLWYSMLSEKKVSEI
jgi:hypothetical protein